MPPKSTLPPGVVGTLRDLSLACGYSVKTVSEWKNRPDFPVRPDGQYDVWAVCSWLHRQQQLKNLKAATNVPEEMEPGEGDSVWLERYREARTHRENLKLEQERRNLLPRELVHQTLMQIAVLIRGCGETLQRQFGPAAIEVLDTTLGEADKIINVVFGPDDDSADDSECDGPDD